MVRNEEPAASSTRARLRNKLLSPFRYSASGCRSTCFVPNSKVPRKTSISIATKSPCRTFITTTCRREQRKQRADHHRRNRVADVAAHAVQRKNQAFALRVALAKRRDRRRMPDAVAKADQRDAREQHRVAVRKADEKVR